jgi:energy-coupling factor transporter ATP-binding protein EcfA2
MQLMGLQPTKHLELLDVVDKLRAQGLNEHVDLPQLIVCGDQSSGKSSVLSAISGVPFPKKENLCTRFATEVVLRRDDTMRENKICVTITPSSTRPRTDRRALDSFTRELNSMDDLPSTIDDATIAMGLDMTGSAFSADILRLEVRGPQMPQLTIVDLPGLVHTESKYQSADDIALVNSLVSEYMSQERSIILAVVSAKNDYVNQIVLTKTRQVDPRGLRTLGIITKPDALHPNSAGERSFIELAQNVDITFSLGWHVVRNKDSNEPADWDRDTLEAEFFQGSQFGRLDPKSRGIVALRERLSEVLFQQIQRELPGLISEILAATEDTRVRLNRMGRSRATALEKQMFVMELGNKFNHICFAACEGLYESPFFDEFNSSTVDRRLRAVVQNANIGFAASMLDAPLALPIDRSKNAAPSLAQRAKELVRSYRGKELPGTFNPNLVGQLFRELSRSWFDHARGHITAVWIHARTTVVAILNEVAEQDVRDICLKKIVDPDLVLMQEEMTTRLDDYMLEFRRQPITYNHYLTETVQKVKYEREYAEARVRCTALFADSERLSSSDVDWITRTIIKKPTEPDMDAIAAQELTDYTEAYYKVNHPLLQRQSRQCFILFRLATSEPLLISCLLR